MQIPTVRLITLKSIETFWWKLKLTGTDLLLWILFVKHQWKSPWTPPPSSSTAGTQPGRFTLPSPRALDGSGSTVYGSKNTESFFPHLFSPSKTLLEPLCHFSVTWTSSGVMANTKLEPSKKQQWTDQNLYRYIHSPPRVRGNDMKETVWKPYDAQKMLWSQWRTDVLPLVRLSSMALAETLSTKQSRRTQNVQTLAIFQMWRVCLVVKR